MIVPVAAVEVRIWNRRVGAVALDPRLGFYAFEYDPEFVRGGVELAPLRMPLARAREPFVFTDLAPETYLRLPAMLADALPDDFGNALVDAWMADHGVSKRDITPLDRLAYMGRRAMGALEFKPERDLGAPKATAVDLAELVEAARSAMRGEFDSPGHDAAALKRLIQVGTSAGGARAKAVIAWNPRTREIRSGQFEAPHGFEHWLLKFDGLGPDGALRAGAEFGRLEYAYHLMARAAGVRMADCRLLEEGGRAHFMTKRFDRDGNRKHHVQTLCALDHLDYRLRGAHSVSQVLEAARRLGLGYEALEEIFRRAAFNVMAANHDNHSKNVAFLLREGGSWELAPAYDLIHAHNPAGEWTSQFLMGVNGKFRGIGREDLLRLAETFGIGTAGKVLDSVAQAVAGWPGWAEEAGVGKAGMERVGRDHRVL